MASNINPFNIDGTFPVAGQDNDSQGFRDNFTNIRNNLGYSKSEIEELQSKAIFKTALTGSTLDNNFAEAPIANAQLRGVSETVKDKGLSTGLVTLDYTLGNVQRIQTSGSVTVSFTGWPTATLSGTMRLWIEVTDVSHTLTLPATLPGVTLGLGNIANANTATGVISFSETGTYVFEFQTVDNGQNILITDLTRNFDNVQGNLTVSGGMIGPNYLYMTRTTGTTVSANVLYESYYLDSLNSATLATQTISIPPTAENGRIMYFTAMCPITTTTWQRDNLKYVPTNVFSSGNVTVKVRYNTTANIWMRS
jgi:hypothetical protein